MKMEFVRKAQYTDDELIYSATSRCPCGEGLAYAKGMKEWDCAGILTGRAIPKGEAGWCSHTDLLPFTFYEVKSENQPSAGTMTTRPRKRK